MKVSVLVMHVLVWVYVIRSTSEQLQLLLFLVFGLESMRTEVIIEKSARQSSSEEYHPRSTLFSLQNVPINVGRFMLP